MIRIRLKKNYCEILYNKRYIYYQYMFMYEICEKFFSLSKTLSQTYYPDFYFENNDLVITKFETFLKIIDNLIVTDLINAYKTAIDSTRRMQILHKFSRLWYDICNFASLDDRKLLENKYIDTFIQLFRETNNFEILSTLSDCLKQGIVLQQQNKLIFVYHIFVLVLGIDNFKIYYKYPSRSKLSNLIDLFLKINFKPINVSFKNVKKFLLLKLYEVIE